MTGDTLHIKLFRVQNFGPRQTKLEELPSYRNYGVGCLLELANTSGLIHQHLQQLGAADRGYLYCVFVDDSIDRPLNLFVHWREIFCKFFHADISTEFTL